MADTTEARRLADELADDADQAQAYIPRLRKSASMLRAIADRCDALEKELQALRDQRPLSKSTRLDALRFRMLIDTSPGCLCFMGQDYSTAEEFRAAIDAYRSQESAR